MQRYKIIENYNGLMDIRNIIAYVDSLYYAILLVEALNKSCDNPCYDYDFIKLDYKVDKNLDCVNGKVIKARRYKDVFISRLDKPKQEKEACI